MSLKNILITVTDIEKSKRFYEEVFGLTVLRDFGENVILSEGLVLQSRTALEQSLEEETVVGNASELFFEENDLDAFFARFTANGNGCIVKEMYRNPFGKRCLMLRDPDGHLIEAAEK